MKLWIAGGITSQFSTLKTRLGSKYNSLYASVDELDFSEKKIDALKRFIPLIEFRSEDLGKDIRYTSCTMVGNKLYACSPTQVYVYDAITLELIQEINHPHFNDIHHVNVIDQKLVIANTGLDSVMIFNLQGQFEKIFSANKYNVWSKFDPTLDYRKIASTKPHFTHPNYVFEINEKIWVTRFHQMDAIELGNEKRRIDIGVGKPHDGHVYGDFIYFTTINGFIVVANIHTLKVEEVINLNKIDERDAPLGWCRSFCMKQGYAFVGFTRLRQTKIESNLRWLREKFTNVKNRLPARIAQYDLVNKKLLDEFIIPKGYTDLIFSIIDPINTQ